ncbi:CGNR zinc finger domain-containing protein [Kitasatospora sp. NBC_01302]|uniref:CGNR zinc finger domain-containing protein n=1 Tax=Kitasatospora sp. NBC_01302 TaxID=2903575 RepID=UPI002E1312C1|nr:CGNR zinc finger domain-containing protein [Kitasatospora sp. NBC_01302]
MPENLADANPRGLHFIVELANAVQDTVQDGTRVGASDLMELLARHGGPPFRLTEADASRLCDATGELIGILAAKEPDAAAEAINALLRRHPARPHLVRLPGRPWSLHAQADPEDGPVPWLLATAALALGLWFSERGGCAWGQCAAPDCAHYFIDTGRRTPQRYCSARCATRVRVAAHRAQRGSAAPGGAGE